MAIKKILISQEMPLNKAPYESLTEKYGVQIDFKPFFLIEPLSSREFRAQRLNVLDYTAIVFSARHTIDAFFQLCEELRVKVPETMKYFCTTEAVAMYLQKHIVFRKRKIFYGNGTPSSVIDQIGAKHKGEKFLITTSDSSNVEPLTSLFKAQGLDFTTSVFVKSVSQDLKSENIEDYDLVVFYNPSDIKSLFENFPDFKPEKVKFVTFGKQIVKAMEEAGLPVEIQAPTPEAPSVARALELYMSAHNA
ncbi:MAG: uroporphyrinogen-III synthase [Candidatus Cryptobacteroides sp.]|nr:uroporphyrinogen-III synthase [Bacteroidales bacterium]MDY3964380.1 uroporphyrinogen-III synthase [Candidatus Cryptobacteroides sp.]